MELYTADTQDTVAVLSLYSSNKAMWNTPTTYMILLLKNCARKEHASTTREYRFPIEKHDGILKEQLIFKLKVEQ